VSVGDQFFSHSNVIEQDIEPFADISGIVWEKVGANVSK